jgi:AcrR family transcriptional regulator
VRNRRLPIHSPVARASREIIVDAAARAFAKGGFGTTTIRDIAREAGCSAPVIYHYFEGKKEIVDEMIMTVNRRFLALFEEPAPTSLTFPQRLELLLTRQLALAERHRDIFALFMVIRPGLAQVGTKSAPAPSEVQARRLAQWFRDNSKRADIGGLDHGDAARFFVSVGQGFVVDWLARGGRPGKLRQQVDLILRLFFHGVGPSCASRSAASDPRMRTRQEHVIGNRSRRR